MVVLAAADHDSDGVVLGFAPEPVIDEGNVEVECAGVVRCSPGRSTSLMAVASDTYDSLPTDFRHELADAERLTAALDWTDDEE